MKIAFTWDDGALEDQKLFALHEKYGLPAVFFVPTRNSEGRRVMTAQMIRRAASPLVHFGGHTASHRYLTEIPFGEVYEELASNKAYLEDILSEEIPHFCLPGGRYTPEIMTLAFQCFRTVRTAETMNLYNSRGIIRPTFHFYPRGTKSLIGNALRHRSYKIAAGALCYTRRGDYAFVKNLIVRTARDPEAQVVIWGHSWELEELGLWEELDDLFRFVSTEYSARCVHYDELFT